MKIKHWLILLFIPISCYGIYTGFVSLKASMKERSEKRKWTAEDHRIMVEDCIKSTGDQGVRFPVLTKTYCECSITKMQEAYDKEAYMEFAEMPFEEQKKELLPVFQDCLTTYQDSLSRHKE